MTEIKTDQESHDFTGILENWAWHPVYKKSLHGNIYEDARGRFPDGTYVITSTLTKLDEENKIAYTLNSTYKLGNTE
jgi:hypothetical protein